MNKVAVIGCPGSGKTYFSRELSKITGLPLIHLDRLYHDKELPEDPVEKRPLWLKQVQKISDNKQWIMDGNYKSSFDIRLSAADTIIVLDYPKYLVIYRLFKRRLQYHNKLRPDMPNGWQERINWDFYKFVWNFKRQYLPLLLDKVKEHGRGKSVIVLSNPEQAKQYLKKLKENSG